MTKTREPQAGDMIVFQDPSVSLEPCDNDQNSQWTFHSRDGVVAYVLKSTKEITTFIINSKFYTSKTDMWKSHCKVGNTYDEIRLAGGDELRRLIRYNRYRY